MNQKVLDHYLAYSQCTYPGLYEAYIKSLPNDIRELGTLVRKQLIHRTTLAAGNTGSNSDMKYGDITKIPWWRQPEDDYFPTAAAMIAELFHRDPNGFTLKRKPEDKLVLTCRFTTLLVASILKAKGIPARVRSGYAPYFPEEKGYSSDHWINEYWSKKENRWVIIDVDGSFHNTGVDMYDLPKNAFDYPAVAWLACRAGKDDPKRFVNAKPATGLKVIGWAIFYDFYCLMNNEVIYVHSPAYLYYKWNRLSKKDLEEIDSLAKLLVNPDENFDKLHHIWNTNKKFRLLKGGLL